MYCPKCSQLQASDDVRFCSRCGFHLKIVSELLLTNGESGSGEKSEGYRFKAFRNRRARIGAKMILLSIFLIIPFIFASFMAENPGPMIFPFIIFLLGAFLITYEKIFGIAASDKKEDISLLEKMKGQFGLPASHSVPITNELKREKEYEAYQPPSVTDNTTKLFNQE